MNRSELLAVCAAIIYAGFQGSDFLPCFTPGQAVLAATAIVDNVNKSPVDRTEAAVEIGQHVGG